MLLLTRPSATFGDYHVVTNCVVPAKHNVKRFERILRLTIQNSMFNLHATEDEAVLICHVMRGEVIVVENAHLEHGVVCTDTEESQRDHAG